MKMTFVAALAATSLATSAFAESHTGSGDPAAGEKEFNKCKACHMIVADDGTQIVRGGRTGPNLYGVAGGPIAADEDFRYGDALAALGETGATWTEEAFVAYVQDPTGYLREALDDSSARSKMVFRLRSGMEDVYAYLASVGPEMTN